MTQPAKKRESFHLLRLAMMALGIVLFYFSIKNFGGGFQNILHQLTILPVWCYIFVILNSVMWTLSYTQAWQYLIREQSHLVRFMSLFKVKSCGEAVNLMTPAGFIVGDPVRVLLMKKYVGGEHARLRSVVVDRVLHSLAAQGFCFLGLLLIFTQDVPFPLWMNLVMLTSYLLILWASATLIISMVTGKGLGFFEPLFQKFKVARRFPKLNSKIILLRGELDYYADKPKGPFFLALFFHFIGRVLGAVELSIVLYYFTGHFLLIFATILTALTSFVSIVVGFVPGAMGFLETLYAAFAKLYGFDPAMGITIQVIRRLRTFLWMAVGILILDYGEIMNLIRSARSDGGRSAR